LNAHRATSMETRARFPAHPLRVIHEAGTHVIHCVLHDPDDSVAVVVVEGIKAGTALTGLILDEDRTIQLECRQDIPIGHKVALKDMAVGDTVIKYGVDIGKVVQPIRKGEHAHVHNNKTKRW
jgi:(2R)-sulfolactate sulfo-lyase subunit alpha